MEKLYHVTCVPYEHPLGYKNEICGQFEDIQAQKDFTYHPGAVLGHRQRRKNKV